MTDEGPTYMQDYRRSQMGKSSSWATCCAAGIQAWPEPCPWHDPEKAALALIEQVRDSEQLDAHIDVYARQVIVEHMELTLAQKDWMSHDLIKDVDWRRIRDRVFYVLAELGPDEEAHQAAVRYLSTEEETS